MRINTKQIMEWCGANVIVEPLDASRLATSITWDSRDVCSDCLYVAFRGERVNGHSFVADALRGGACIVMVMDPLPEPVKLLAREMGAAILEVPDTKHAFVDLAARWRHQLSAQFIALTGSTGKTTTKNFVRDVLATTFVTTATKANQNNELGVPNTLLSANPETQFVVVEMGMRGRGQIEELCNLVEPDAALITNIGKSHIELLGSQENIARAKSEIIESLPAGRGKAFINASDPWSDEVLAFGHAVQHAVQVRYFDGSGSCVTEEASEATKEQCANRRAKECVWASNIELDEQGAAHFLLNFPEGAYECHLALRGTHNVDNACAAACVGYTFGVSPENIVKGLESSLPEVGRQEIVTGRNGCTIINDAYNANPDSMRASLSMLCSMKVNHKRFAVLGDMGELGSYAQACHEGIGAFVATLPIDRLICVGTLARFIADAAREAGYPAKQIYCAQTRGEALNDLETHVQPGDVVLVKASHAMELERIVRGLSS